MKFDPMTAGRGVPGRGSGGLSIIRSKIPRVANMLTSTACSTRRHFKGIKATLAFLLVAPMSALAQTTTSGENLYFLAEIAADIHIGGSGLNLYALDSSHKLKLIREIVPVPDPTNLGALGYGVYAVRDDLGDKIYVAYPNTSPSIVSVIHKDRPAFNDEVVFNQDPGHQFVLSTDFGIAAGDGRQSYLVCTFLRDIPNYKGPYPGGVSSSLVSIAGDASANGPRVRQGDWNMFNSFRYQGAPGGEKPLPGIDPLGYIKDNHLRIRAEAGSGPYTMKLDLDSVPPFSIEGDPGDILFIVAASARYFAFIPLIRSLEQPFPYPVPPYVCVHDRKRNTWKKLTTSSTVPNTRKIFGSWLATIVEVPHPGELVKNPGTENEQTQTSIPGTLVLDNLEDGRRIMLNTGQADSEILTVREDGLVLYRVNDSIFAAQIEGNKLSKPTLVVKDEDVPGVHWVFWPPPA
jgi:hypothetical protein